MPEKIYVVLREDRHTDAEVLVYKDPDAALLETIAWMKAQAERYGTEFETHNVSDWILCASIEDGCNVRIEEQSFAGGSPDAD